MMLVWNNLADPYLSAFSDFARFSQTLTLKFLKKYLLPIIKSVCDFKEHGVYFKSGVRVN